MRLLVVDNYDSFTWNLVHYLTVLGAEVEVRRNDVVSVREALEGAEAIVISPGPGRPDGAGISLALVGGCAEARKPLLGVCLGHQAIGQFFGSSVTPAATLMHGKTSQIVHDASGVFAALPSPFTATRYHSLSVPEDSLPDCLRVTARSQDATIMGLAHRTLPIHGVQFHPESIASEQGHKLLANFLAIARVAA